MKLLTATLLLFVVSTSCYANIDSTNNKYIVDSLELYVREQPSTNSKIIGKIFKNDTIISVSASEYWTKIYFKGQFGYISSKYITKVENNGFKVGFKKGFESSFFVIAFGIAAFIYFKSKRVKDARYKSGYRVLTYTLAELLKIVLYSVILSLVIGLITGIVSWFKTF